MIKITSPEHAARRMTYAARNHFPVTITYTRQDGTQTVRTIEVYEFTRNKAGDRYVKAMVRASKPEDNPAGELRSFRLDRVNFITIHRSHFKLTVPEPKSVQRPVVRPADEILREMAGAGRTVGQYAIRISGGEILR
jgi:predicted DNA-binding transcriptional regulator YafY